MVTYSGLLVLTLALAVGCGDSPRGKPQLNDKAEHDENESDKAEVEAEENLDNDDGDPPATVNTPAPYSCAEPRPFISVWEVLSDGTVRLPIAPDAGVYNFTVDWGDGSETEEISNLGQRVAEHEYEFGEFTITIEGHVGKAWNAKLSTEKSGDANLVAVEDLGNVRWESLQGAFYKNSQLEVIKGGCTAEVTDMSHMFQGATNANPDVSTWNTSNVTDMSLMFREATNANPDVSTWNTSNVTDMGGMFWEATNANPDVSNWDTSNVKDMDGMFREATNAQPDVSTWNTSNVTDMGNMFSGATSAQPDVSTWNTSNVTDMGSMFSGATSANPDVSNWDFSSITWIFYMFNSKNGLSTENYSTLLKKLATYPSAGGLPDGRVGGDETYLFVGSVKYNADAESARSHLISEHDFSIKDGGQAP